MSSCSLLLGPNMHHTSPIIKHYDNGEDDDDDGDDNMTISIPQTYRIKQRESRYQTISHSPLKRQMYSLLRQQRQQEQ